MENGKAGSDNKILIIIFTVLCVLAVGLGVVVGINTIKHQAEIAENSKSSNNKNEDLYWDDMDEEDYENSKIREEYRDVREKVKELLQEETVDVGRINELYDGIINKAIDSDRTYDSITYVIARNEDFLSKGLKQEALDALMSSNLDVYTEADRYRLYTIIIGLAEELGRNDVAVKYQELRKTVEAAYLEDYYATLESEMQYIEEEGGIDE